MFSLKGIIVLDNEEGTIDEDKAMEDILEAGYILPSLLLPYFSRNKNAE